MLVWFESSDTPARRRWVCILAVLDHVSDLSWNGSGASNVDG
jgi:hypothetical protein